MQDLVNYCKKNLRIDEDIEDFDTEIETLINAAILDLETFALKDIDIEDSLIRTAITFFVKGNFGIENKDFEKNNKMYEMMKKNLHLTQKYNKRASEE